MSPRRRRSRPPSSAGIKPGLVLFADTWPDWEHQGAPAPHPLIVVKVRDCTRVMVLPISTKRLGRALVRLDRDDYPTLFSDNGPLSDTNSAIILADRYGDRTNVWGELADDVLKLGVISIRVRNGKQLSDPEWEHLKQRIIEASRDLS